MYFACLCRPRSGLIGHTKVPIIVFYANAKEWNVADWRTVSVGTKRGKKIKDNLVVAECSKLHFCRDEYTRKHSLPEGLDYLKATTDYLKEVIKVCESFTRLRISLHVLIL